MLTFLYQSILGDSNKAAEPSQTPIAHSDLGARACCNAYANSRRDDGNDAASQYAGNGNGHQWPMIHSVKSPFIRERGFFIEGTRRIFLQQTIHGNIAGLNKATISQIETLYSFTMDKSEFASLTLLETMAQLTAKTNREISVLIARDGTVKDVSIGH